MLNLPGDETKERGGIGERDENLFIGSVKWQDREVSYIFIC